MELGRTELLPKNTRDHVAVVYICNTHKATGLCTCSCVCMAAA